MRDIHKAYDLIGKTGLGDIHSVGYILRHRKSGAHLALVENSDDNKVFYIGFRTPPEDSTGVAHIIEHSVLCGSEKYPAKDPFVELVKGSLNTFLNAMTYPDKTVYPIASCNMVDFSNLMDVYLDAVFHPNIYKKSEIFRQEGWHYEMFEPDGEITINGVVYNEMKGAFSSPDDVLSREIFNSLFPDNAYGVESGGDPRYIPDLTYENFLDFHKKYYHPSNSFIYLYGDMDMNERLDYLDREYLSKYDAIELDSRVKFQEPFLEQRPVEKAYPVAVGEDTSHKTYLS
ncbi:MAG: insulinase family protein, partial [Lachnospiraceae bacterium]|nr:insulinase family protein [Lachnospiraceae bacterium]